MKRLLLFSCLALLAVPAAMAKGGGSASILLNETPVFNTHVDFTVTLDKGSEASVAVQCFSPTNGQGNQWNGTPMFDASPGAPVVSPQVLMTAWAGSSCTAYLYRWVLKPNGSWSQTIAATEIFTAQ